MLQYPTHVDDTFSLSQLEVTRSTFHTDWVLAASLASLLGLVPMYHSTKSANWMKPVLLLSKMRIASFASASEMSVPSFELQQNTMKNSKHRTPFVAHHQQEAKIPGFMWHAGIYCM